MKKCLLFVLFFLWLVPILSVDAVEYPTGQGPSIVTIQLSYFRDVGSLASVNPERGLFKLKAGLGDLWNGAFISVRVVPGNPPPWKDFTDKFITYPVRVEYDSNFWHGVPKSVRDKINVRLTVQAKPHWDQTGAVPLKTQPLTTMFGYNEGSPESPYRIDAWSNNWWVYQDNRIGVEIWLEPDIADTISTGHFFYNSPNLLQTVLLPNQAVAPFVLPLTLIYRPPGNQSWSNVTVKSRAGSTVSLYKGTSESISREESMGIGPLNYSPSPTVSVKREHGQGTSQRIVSTRSANFPTINPLGPGAGDRMIVAVRPTFNLYKALGDIDAVLLDGQELIVGQIQMNTLLSPPPRSTSGSLNNIASDLSPQERAYLIALDPLLTNPRAPLSSNPRYLPLPPVHYYPYGGGPVGGGLEKTAITGTEVLDAYARSSSTTQTSGISVPIGSLAGAAGVPIPLDFSSRQTETTTSTMEFRTTNSLDVTNENIAEYQIWDSDPAKSMIVDVYYDTMFGSLAFQERSAPAEIALINQLQTRFNLKTIALTGFRTTAGTKAGHFMVAGSLGATSAGGGTALVTPSNTSKTPVRVSVMKGTGNLIVPDLAPGQYHIAYNKQAWSMTVNAQGQVAIAATTAPAPRPVLLRPVLKPVPVLSASMALALQNPSAINQNSRKCLDVAGGSKADQANVQQYSCNNGLNQRWLLKQVTRGEYQIISENSGKCLDVAGGSKADQANIQQFSCHQGPNQRWRVNPVGKDLYQIISVNSGKCLDVAGGSKVDQANVQQYTCHTGANQQWQISGISDLVSLAR